MVDPMMHKLLQANLRQVEERMAAACRRAGRGRSEVTLVAVAKTVTAEVAALLTELGVLDLGESRPQELWHKAEGVPQARWHLIGHLQRNKVERTLPLVHIIHSVDSLRLLDAVDQEAIRQGKRTTALLEVNASGEANKQGFAPEELLAGASAIQSATHVDVVGLMTMAALQDAEACRPTFVRLRELRDRLQGEIGRPLPHLSMGMSNDFEVAIEEGATFIRLGSVLFEGLPT
jgi:pyridoxal phosphate enzyme (YggS family)